MRVRLRPSPNGVGRSEWEYSLCGRGGGGSELWWDLKKFNRFLRDNVRVLFGIDSEGEGRFSGKIEDARLNKEEIS